MVQQSAILLLFEVVSAYNTVSLSFGIRLDQVKSVHAALERFEIDHSCERRSLGIIVDVRTYAVDHAVLLPYELCADTLTFTIGSEGGCEGAMMEMKTGRGFGCDNGK